MFRIECIYDVKIVKFKEICDIVDEIYEVNLRVIGKVLMIFMKFVKFMIIGYIIKEI